MKKALKKVSIVALSGILCLSSLSLGYAATKTKTGGGVLKEYNSKLSSQRAELAELIQDSKALTKTIITTQKEAKQSGRIDKTASDKLAAMSADIKAKRVELTEARLDSSALRKEAKEARLSSDFDLASQNLTKLSDLYSNQISIREDLVELLKKKLDYLDNLDVVTDQSADSSEDKTTELIDETKESTTESTETIEESIPSEAELDAALDDGAELEDGISIDEILSF